MKTTESKTKSESPSVASKWQIIRENTKTVAIALVLAVLIRFFIAEPRYIPSESMIPTLVEGDRLVIEKVSYRIHPPQPGDIVVFHPPQQLQLQGYQSNQAFIKRVVATGGQTIKIIDGQVYINGEPLREDYVWEPPNYQLLPVKIPANYLFVMGDNRNNSNDSHIWGFLPETEVIGRAVFRFWPLTRIGTI